MKKKTKKTHSQTPIRLSWPNINCQKRQKKINKIIHNSKLLSDRMLEINLVVIKEPLLNSFLFFFSLFSIRFVAVECCCLAYILYFIQVSLVDCISTKHTYCSFSQRSITMLVTQSVLRSIFKYIYIVTLFVTFLTFLNKISSFSISDRHHYHHQ